jgi:hypothetical protein
MTNETVTRLSFASWRGQCPYDYCQDHNEGASGKAERGYADTSLDD